MLVILVIDEERFGAAPYTIDLNSTICEAGERRVATVALRNGSDCLFPSIPTTGELVISNRDFNKANGSFDVVLESAATGAVHVSGRFEFEGVAAQMRMIDLIYYDLCNI